MKFKMSRFQMRLLSLEASVDERTFRKVLNGKKVAPMPRARILAVLAKHGIEEPTVGDEGHVSSTPDT